MATYDRIYCTYFSPQSGCYEDFSGVSMTVLRDVKVPTNSPDLPGYGPSQNIFRTDEDLKLHVTTSGLLLFSLQSGTNRDVS